MVSTRQSGNNTNSDNGTIIKTRHVTSGQRSEGKHGLRNSNKHNENTDSTTLPELPVPANVQTTEVVSTVNIVDLPPDIFHKIFTYVGYKQAAELRIVCRDFNNKCSLVLNSAFQKLQTQMLQRFHSIKQRMPRRESARRNHPLACECDIIETLHMRLTLMQMSFGKHIERRHICFFPGEILDEVHRIIHYIHTTPKLNRPYRVTDELFDLSTMAMEYFKEYIEPRLPEISYIGTDLIGDYHFSSSSSSPTHSETKSGYETLTIAENQTQKSPTNVLRKRINRIKDSMKRYDAKLGLLKRELRTTKSKMTDQQKQYVELISRMDEYDKKNEENSKKFSTLLQELNKCKTELQYWRSKSPMTSVCMSCGNKSGNAFGNFVWKDPSNSIEWDCSSSIASIDFDDTQPSTSRSTLPSSETVDTDSILELSSFQPPELNDVQTTELTALGKHKSSTVEPETTNAKKTRRPRVPILKGRAKKCNLK